MPKLRNLTCIGMTLCFASSAFAAEMAPHRASYKITFGSSSPQSSITAGAGKWVLQIEGGHCNGYNVAYRFVSKLRADTGTEILLDTQGKYFEENDASHFDFSNKVFQNTEIQDDVEGTANRETNKINVELRKPKAEAISIEGDVLFPVQHFLKVIDNAKAGEQFVNNLVYEGIEGARTAMLASTLILPEKEVEEGEGLPYQELEDQKLRRWPVSISYFDVNSKGDGKPEWQNSFLLYENGVARNFTFDYGDFSLKGTLEGLQLLEKEQC